MWHPARKEVAYVTRPGLSFGLKAAPVLFNRFSKRITLMSRLIMACCSTTFFDDGATVEPTFAKKSGQAALATIARLIGRSEAASTDGANLYLSWSRDRPIAHMAAA
eukprot:3289891-Prymnesium_polylepis.1